MTLVALLDYIGIALFAATGALSASRSLSRVSRTVARVTGGISCIAVFVGYRATPEKNPHQVRGRG